MNKDRLKKVIIRLIILLSIFLIYFFLNKHLGFAIVCPFHYLTKFYCPGCGITRCLFALLRLDFKSAFMYNQLVFILLPFFIIYVAYLCYIYVYNKENIIKDIIPNYVIYILLVIVIAFGVIRNFECFPYLRPPV